MKNFIVRRPTKASPPQEEEDFDLTQAGDKQRHLRDRDSDHLMVPFQCDLCHFRNIAQRDPGQSGADVKLIVSIRRATFWSREPGTVVVATRKKGVNIKKLGYLMGLSNISPETRSLPLEDTMGMGIVVCMLQRSLDKGRYKDNLLFESVRNLRSAYLNIWYSFRQTLTTSVMSRDLKKTYVTFCPTYGL